MRQSDALHGGILCEQNPMPQKLAFHQARLATIQKDGSPVSTGLIMVGQLRLRKAGLGPSTDASAPMTPIAQRLNDDDIRAVSAYFATLPPAR